MSDEEFQKAFSDLGGEGPAKETLLELAADKGDQKRRAKVSSVYADALARTGKLLWIHGSLLGPDRIEGQSPFGWGSDDVVGLATVCQVGGELALGAIDLLKADNLYAAQALARQLVEVEYLASAFAEKDEIAAEWMRADRDQRRKFWSPPELRKRSNGRYLREDYSLQAVLRRAARTEDESVDRGPHPLLHPSERALSRALQPADERGYCVTLEQNLIEAVTPQRWEQVRIELQRGRGAELDSKFRAAFSSAALAVNSFAPRRFVSLPHEESFAGVISFEQDRSAWAGGFPPTLDVVVEPEDGSTHLYIESKCVEYLRRSDTAFSDAFVRIATERLRPAAAEVYAAAASDPHLFGRVDARQLLKHFLAAKKTAIEERSPVLLLYLYWEPRDATEHPVFREHSASAAKLAAALPDDGVRLMPLSYPELWRHWAGEGPDSAAQVRQLMWRYDVTVSG